MMAAWNSARPRSSVVSTDRWFAKDDDVRWLPTVIFIGCFVWGLNPRRAGRVAIANVPKPTSETSLSRFNPRL